MLDAWSRILVLLFQRKRKEIFKKACICTGIIETRHDNLYCSPVTALTVVAHHGMSEQEQALEEPSVRLTLTSTAMSKHISIIKKLQSETKLSFISAFTLVFLESICTTAICAVVNTVKRDQLSFEALHLTPSPDLDGLQFYCLLSVIISVRDNKAKVFLGEIDCNQFQRFACNRGQSEFHGVFTRWIQNPFSSLQNSQLLLVKNNKYTHTYVSPRTVLWHLSDICMYERVAQLCFHLQLTQMRRWFPVWIRSESVIKESINPVLYSQIFLNT